MVADVHAGADLDDLIAALVTPAAGTASRCGARRGSGPGTCSSTSTSPRTTSKGRGIATVEGLGAVTVARIEAWLARHTAAGGRVRVTPVVDPERTDAVDRHDPPPWMAEQVRLRDQQCVFPYCQTTPVTATWTTSSRTSHPTRADHPARPTRRIWRRCVGDITGRRPRSDGATNATPTGPMPGPHPTPTATSSGTAAPSPSPTTEPCAPSTRAVLGAWTEPRSYVLVRLPGRSAGTLGLPLGRSPGPSSSTGPPPGP